MVKMIKLALDNQYEVVERLHLAHDIVSWRGSAVIVYSI